MEEEVSKQAAVFRLHQFLDDGFAKSLSGMALCVSPSYTRGINIELFLAALYLNIGSRVSAYFADQNAFQAMTADIFPSGLVAQRHLSRTSGHGVIMPWETHMLPLLWRAARITRAIGNEKIDLTAFIAALAVSDDVLIMLDRDRGVKLKGSLEPLAGT